MDLYEYAVFTDYDNETGELIIPPTPVLARDEAYVRIIAARAVPEGTDLDAIQIVVRPFDG